MSRWGSSCRGCHVDKVLAIRFSTVTMVCAAKTATWRISSLNPRDSSFPSASKRSIQKPHRCKHTAGGPWYSGPPSMYCKPSSGVRSVWPTFSWAHPKRHTEAWGIQSQATCSLHSLMDTSSCARRSSSRACRRASVA